MAGQRRAWLAEVIAYTLSGTISSGLVGAALGWLGNFLFPDTLSTGKLAILLGVAGVGLAREWGLLSFPVPQRKRQTRDYWAKILPGPVAAMLWGLDLGLIFNTRLTFSGAWVLVAVAVLVGEPAFGATMFGSYWLGRALSVWIAPLAMNDANATPEFLDKVTANLRLFQRTHTIGLVWLTTALVWWLIGPGMT